MILWVWIILTLLLILTGLVFHKCKFLAILQSFWIWVLMAFNAGGVDYSGYIHIYQISRDLTYNGVEYLYHLACYLGNILSLDLLSFE